MTDLKEMEAEMVKHYCDCCGEEVEVNLVSTRPRGKVKVKDTFVLLEVIGGINSTWNSGDICPACLKEALALLLDGKTFSGVPNRPEKHLPNLLINDTAGGSYSATPPVIPKAANQ